MAPGSLVAACRSLALSTWLLSFCFVHLLCLDFTVAEREEWFTAFVNITYMDPATSELRTEKTECGRYGEQSSKREARGTVVLPAAPLDRQACDPHTRFAVPPQAAAGWVALIAGGNCTYKDKFRHAVAHNASAVVVFNHYGTLFTRGLLVSGAGAGEVVAIMIPEPKGREVVALLERNITVTMTITIGTRNLQKYVSRTSVVFVSISFIVLMIISLAWLVFYYIQRFRYANRRLGDAAKKAISKLQLRTIRKGDQETESDFDNCAVCIEGYKANDVVRILPCELQPMASSASVASLVIAVETGLSDEEGSIEQPQTDSEQTLMVQRETARLENPPHPNLLDGLVLDHVQFEMKNDPEPAP
uniref:Ring finger protein 150b n=1 Tax=Fundulus heteroclitus TaxID=8078 RepID=A0A3Q2QGA0_FUNHE